VTSDVPPPQNPDSTEEKKNHYNVELSDSSLKFDVITLLLFFSPLPAAISLLPGVWFHLRNIYSITDRKYPKLKIYQSIL
jgi:hypothetical protein